MTSAAAGAGIGVGTRQDALHQVEQALAPRPRLGVAGQAARLVEAAGRRARDLRQVGVRVRALLPYDRLQRSGRQAAEAHRLAARLHRRQHAGPLVRQQEERRVGGRLLERLEEGVGRVRGEPLRLAHTYTRAAALEGAHGQVVQSSPTCSMRISSSSAAHGEVGVDLVLDAVVRRAGAAAQLARGLVHAQPGGPCSRWAWPGCSAARLSRRWASGCPGTANALSASWIASHTRASTSSARAVWRRWCARGPASRPAIASKPAATRSWKASSSRSMRSSSARVSARPPAQGRGRTAGRRRRNADPRTGSSPSSPAPP